jgi:hypothetical protein
LAAGTRADAMAANSSHVDRGFGNSCLPVSAGTGPLSGRTGREAFADHAGTAIQGLQRQPSQTQPATAPSTKQCASQSRATQHGQLRAQADGGPSTAVAQPVMGIWPVATPAAQSTDARLDENPQHMNAMVAPTATGEAEGVSERGTQTSALSRAAPAVPWPLHNTVLGHMHRPDPSSAAPQCAPCPGPAQTEHPVRRESAQATATERWYQPQSSIAAQSQATLRYTAALTPSQTRTDCEPGPSNSQVSAKDAIAERCVHLAGNLITTADCDSTEGGMETCLCDPLSCRRLMFSLLATSLA